MTTQETIEKVAQDVFSTGSLRPWQTLIITNILEKGRRPNLLAILPTGAGKSLCFMLPSVLLPGLSVIIYPLLSLMNDQKKRFDRLGIPAVMLKGGMSTLERNEAFTALADGSAKVLITNVEMLGQHSVLERLSRLEISLLVLDEAHTVITWGRSFRPAYRMLGQITESLKPGRITAFTATSDGETTRLLKEEVLGEDALVVHGGIDRENIIYHSVQPVFPLLDMISILEKPESRPALVFCRSRSLASHLASRLSGIYRTYCYHAGLEKEERVEIEKAFFNDREAVMVSTCAYGMGVDKSDIRTCIHYGLPDGASDYLQESGRIGRDGALSHAYAFTSLSYRKSPLEEVFECGECIRSALIRRMGSSLDSSCCGCDVCDRSHRKPMGLDEVERVLRIPYLRKKDDAIRILCHRKSMRVLTRKEISEGLDRLVERGMAKVRFNRLRMVKKV